MPLFFVALKYTMKRKNPNKLTSLREYFNY